MRSLLLIGLAACVHAQPPQSPQSASPSKDPLPALPSAAIAPPPVLSLGELGADGVGVEWIELQMPADARVLTYARDVTEGRETWTLLEAGERRVLRVRLEGTKTGQAAWVGTTTRRDAIDLRLVEVRGQVRFAPERMSASCRADKVCEEGKAAHRAAVSMCELQAPEGVAEVAFFAPGRGIDFPVGSCPVPRSTMNRRF